MIYRLKEFKGDTIPVPQLVFSKLGIAEEYNVRVALYVLATGITDPEKLCADLKLRSKMTAESALSFWAGAGLLERYEENAALCYTVEKTGGRKHGNHDYRHRGGGPGRARPPSPCG